MCSECCGRCAAGDVYAGGVVGCGEVGALACSYDVLMGKLGMGSFGCGIEGR